MSPTLDIVIVNWNTGSALGGCVASIPEAGRGIRLERVVVIDNASSDESLALAEKEPAVTETLRNETNRGFGAACNQGARGSRADYLLFLNPDTRLEPGSLATVLAFMDAPAQAQTGICGIRLVDEHGRPSTVGARLPSVRGFVGDATGLSRVLPSMFPSHLVSAADRAATGEVEQVIGAFFLVRRALFEALGGFDERFFMYFEEVDFSLRARRRGWRSMYLATVTAFHHGGLSSGRVKSTRLFYSLRSRVLYAFTHFGFAEAWVTLAVTFGLELPARAMQSLARKKELGGIAGAYRRLWRFARARGWRGTSALQREP